VERKGEEVRPRVEKAWPRVEQGEEARREVTARGRETAVDGTWRLPEARWTAGLRGLRCARTQANTSRELP
jgi:hypothetical protein